MLLSLMTSILPMYPVGSEQPSSKRHMTSGSSTCVRILPAPSLFGIKHTMYTCDLLLMVNRKKNLARKTERIFQMPYMRRFFTQNITPNSPRKTEFTSVQSFRDVLVLLHIFSLILHRRANPRPLLL